MNIELHGFLPEHAKDIAERVWGKLESSLPKEKSDDCAVTIANDQAYDHNGRNAPLIRVISDDRKDFDLACSFLKPIRMPGAGMKTFVECILLADCREL